MVKFNVFEYKNGYYFTHGFNYFLRKFYFNEKLKKYFNLNTKYLNYNVGFKKNFRK